MQTPRVPRDFATALRAGRTIRGFSVRDVAQGTGLTMWKLVSFEKGEEIPRPEEFARLWSFLSTGEPTAREGK